MISELLHVAAKFGSGIRFRSSLFEFCSTRTFGTAHAARLHWNWDSWEVAGHGARTIDACIYGPEYRDKNEIKGVSYTLNYSKKRK
jgi:hypothetical protein